MLKVKKSKWMKVTAFLLIAVLLIGFSTFVSSAENIDMENPTLEFINIDSDAETAVTGLPYYKCDGKLEQGNGTYTITSNAYVPWLLRDDVSFAYNVYNVSDKKGDTITYEVTLDSFEATSGALSGNAHAGLMFRSGLGVDAAEIFVHYRPGGGIITVYRSLTGKTTLVRYGLKSITFPIQFKLEKTETTVTPYYKDATMNSYVTFPLADFPFSASGPLYAGPAVCAQAMTPDQYVCGTFSNIRVTGNGTYVPSEDGGDSDEGEVRPPELDEDIPLLDKNVVLYETFSDMDTKDGKMAVGEYVWRGTENASLEIENKNCFLSRQFTDEGHMYIGDESWTDYKVSADVRFSSSNETDYLASDVAFRMIARCTRNVFYGVSGYAAVLKNTKTGPVVALYKQTNATETAFTDGTFIESVNVDNFYGDGRWHNLMIQTFDNNVKVYWDGVCKIDFTDDGVTYGTVKHGGLVGDVCAQGAIGFSTNQAYVDVDNITVTEIEDTLNGSFDNFIGDMWNEKIPEYILKAIEEDVVYKY